jgi:hypothetical protein
MKGLGTSDLPTSVRRSIVIYVDHRSLLRLIIYAISIYLSVVLLGTLLNLITTILGHQVLKQGPDCVTDFWTLLYFSFTSILTLDYGDLVPLGFGKFISIFEGFAGISIVGAFIGVLIIKLMLPRKNAIVFSKYCYFDKSEKRFIVVFINTMDMPLVNAAMSSILKIGGGHWGVFPAYTAPYIGDSAWTFSINPLGRYDNNYDPDDDSYLERDIDLIGREIYTDDDGIKFGISGSYGFAGYSTAKKYFLPDVWVIPNKASLPLNVLRKPPRDLSIKQFVDAFHFVPPNSVSFINFARQCGATIKSRGV